MRRSKLPAVLLVIALVAALAILFGWWLGPRLRPPPEGPPPAAQAPAPSAAGALSFDELARLLQADAADPAARAFAREFAAKPRLRALWNRFAAGASRSRARQEAGPSAKDFIRELKATQEWGELFAKAAADAAFRALAERLAARAGLGDAVREVAAGAKAAAPVGEAGRVYGLYAAEPPGQGGRSAGDVVETPAGGTASGAAGARAPADLRIEGHWVQDGGPDFLAVCRKLGPGGQCERALAACRRDAKCSKSVSAYGDRLTGAGHGVAAVSTSTTRGMGPTPLPSPKPSPSLSP